MPIDRKELRSYPWTSLAPLVCVAMFIACADSESIPLAVRNASPQQSSLERNERPEERDFHDLARTVPGFGGYVTNAAGEMTIWLADTRLEAAARAAIVKLEEQRAANVGTRQQVSSVRIRRADYDFGSLARWRDAISSSLLGSFAGLLEVDLSERDNRILLGVDNSRIDAIKTEVALQLDVLGVPSGAVEVHGVAPTIPSVGSPSGNSSTPVSAFFSGQTLLTPALPVVGGHRMVRYNAGACTYTLAVTRSGQKGIVANSHCTATTYHPDPGYEVFNTSVSYPLGIETVDPDAFSCLFGSVTKLCRFSDAAFFAVYDSVPIRRGAIARTTSYASVWGVAGSLDIDSVKQFFPVTSVFRSSSISIGMSLMKVGRTTGWTEGFVRQTCVDVLGGTDNLVRRCTTKADYFADGGDSGAPVFRIANGDAAELIGIHWGAGSSSTSFSNWDRVENELGALVETTDISIGPSTLAGYVAAARPNLSWSAANTTNTILATEYRVLRSVFDATQGAYSEWSATVFASTTQLSWIDQSKVVNTYYGTSLPPAGVNYVEYTILAINHGVSSRSATIRFRLTGAY